MSNDDYKGSGMKQEMRAKPEVKVLEGHKTQRERLRVAYLAGTSYCGSTMMAFLMDTHPQIASVGETGLHRAAHRKGTEAQFPCSCGEPLSHCAFWQQIAQRTKEQGCEVNILQGGEGYKYHNRLLHKLLGRYSRNLFLHIFQDLAVSRLPIHRTRIQRSNEKSVALIRAVREWKKAEVFFDASKSVIRLYHLLRIPELDMQIVRVVRDVRAFANSAKRNKGKSVEQGAMEWYAYQRNLNHLLRSVSPQKVFFLRYEDLCQDPRHWLQRLYQFFGVEVREPPEMILAHQHHIIGNRMRLQEKFTIRLDESWKEELTANEVAQALRIGGELNASFGYTP
jgi:hypothetical protein